MLGFARGLAHGDDGRSGGHGIGDADKCLKRYALLPGPDKRKDACAHKRESQAHPVSACAVWVHAYQNGGGSAQSGNLRQSQVNENYTAFHNMHTQIGVYACQYQTGEKRKDQKLKDFHVAYLVSSKAFVSCAIS